MLKKFIRKYRAYKVLRDFEKQFKLELKVLSDMQNRQISELAIQLSKDVPMFLHYSPHYDSIATVKRLERYFGNKMQIAETRIESQIFFTLLIQLAITEYKYKLNEVLH